MWSFVTRKFWTVSLATANLIPVASIRPESAIVLFENVSFTTLNQKLAVLSNSPRFQAPLSLNQISPCAILAGQIYTVSKWINARQPAWIVPMRLLRRALAVRSH